VLQDGSGEYWIPGHQEELPTVPIPPNGSRTAKLSGALAFNQALGADAHRVYVSDLDTADAGFEVELRAPNNIIGVPGAYSTAGKQYYWRVDPVFQGTQRRGSTWQYQVAAPVVEPLPVSQCVNFAGAVGATHSGWTDFPLDVPANAGLGKRFVLSSTKICVHAVGQFTTGYQLRLQGKKGKLLGAFWGHKAKTLSGLSEIQGCFSDVGVKYEPSAIVTGATWKPRKGGWETVDTISAYVAEEDVANQPVSFSLRIKGSQGLGELKGWSMEFCFDAIPDEPLPPAGSGACLHYGYA
jgi:hypothetical protein